MTLEGKRVLVTGGTGAIGGRLVEKLVLEHRARVRVLVRNFTHASRLARFPVEMISGDLADREAVRRAVSECDVVFHCAYDFAGDKQRQKKAGIDGTRHICEAVLEKNVARLVYVSSFSVYGWTPDGDLTEASAWQGGYSTYREVKRAADRLILKLHQERDLPVVTLQPTLVYGPFSAWTMGPISELKTGTVPLLNRGSGYCNAVYIDDVANALVQAAVRPGILGEVFLISAEKPVTWKEFYGAHERALGVRATVDITEEELRREMRKERKQSGGLAQLVSLVRQPEVSDRLLGLPPMQFVLRTVKRCLNQSNWNSLKSATLGAEGIGSNGVSPRPLCVPNETLLALYQSKTHVRIDKAKDRLGYSPQFEFERGMEMITRFIQWANLG